MFRRGLAYLKIFDWAAIVGSALALAFCLLVLIPAEKQPGTQTGYAQQTCEYYRATKSRPPGLFNGLGCWFDGAKDDIEAFSTLAVALFTVVLAISTIGLWRQTARLAEGADDQSAKMVAAINATLSVSGRTKEVADAMDEAASAMRSLAGISEAAMRATQKSNERELRAYLSVEPGAVNQLIGSHDAMGHVIVRNVGRIPAHNVSVRVHMLISGDRNVELPPADRDIENVMRAIQPGAEMRQGSIEMHPAIELSKAGKYVFVWGVAYYDDGYGNHRFTRFCHRYSTASHNRGPNWSATTPSTRSIVDRDKARYHTNGNEAD